MRPTGHGWKYFTSIARLTPPRIGSPQNPGRESVAIDQVEQLSVSARVAWSVGVEPEAWGGETRERGEMGRAEARLATTRSSALLLGLPVVPGSGSTLGLYVLVNEPRLRGAMYVSEAVVES